MGIFIAGKSEMQSCSRYRFLKLKKLNSQVLLSDDGSEDCKSRCMQCHLNHDFNCEMKFHLVMRTVVPFFECTGYGEYEDLHLYISKMEKSSKGGGG